jgi:peptide/nickel transport system ATP-binding protein
MSAVPVPDPARRRLKHGIVADELKSPIRPPNHKTQPLKYVEISPGHQVAL